MSEICVSIFMLTYNQESFISQTINSVLKQNTNFRYQLVIGEDFSTDKTREICEMYAMQHRDRIKLLDSDKKYGLIQNFIRTLKQCDGKYVAILDGDDYWTDPLKLQKQVDFLDKNPEFSIVYTGIRNLYPSGEFRLKTWPDIKGPKIFDDLIFGNFIPSATAVFINNQKREYFPSWIGNFPYGDWPIYLWTIKNGGKIAYLDEVTAVYRKEIGVSEKLKLVSSDIARVNLDIVKCIYNDKQFAHKKNIVKSSLRNHQFSLMSNLFRERKFADSFKIGLKLFFVKPIKTVRIYIYIIKRIYFKKSF